MEFTKEQIETAKKILESYRVVQNRHHNFENYLDSLLKPETKLIDVRIEYKDGIKIYGEDISANTLGIYLTSTNSPIMPGQIKVTELPEMFTRQDMIEFANYHHHVDETVETNINDWLSQRKSK